ncbi:hypothetical protein HQ585_12890 [candidate division KSB1 bacterium]|nr:hypothetical protein [candidate division KSB1 bacterium]
MCKAYGIKVEAELGTLNNEGLEITEKNRDRLFTNSDKAAARSIILPMLYQARQAVKKVVQEKMQVFESTGRA